ncbi:MAG: DNA translocase FtsK [Stappiaceae bacterium]
MRGGRGSALGIREPDSRFSNFVRRNLVGAGGLLTIAVTAGYAAALATWSVNDPSLSHATDSPVRNALGMPGAVLADLTIQIIGLAASVFLLPAIIWGWRLLMGRPPVATRRHVLAWLVGTMFAAAAVSALPTPETWPLPTALGGVVGSALVALPNALTGSFSSGLQTIVGMLSFGVPALIFLAFSVNMFGSQYAPPKKKQTKARSRPAKSEPVFEEFDEDMDEDHGGMSAAFGALAHWALMFKSLLLRLFSPFMRKAPAETYDHDDGLEEFYRDAETMPAEPRLSSPDHGYAEDLTAERDQPDDAWDDDIPALGGMEQDRLKPVGIASPPMADNDDGPSAPTTKSRVVPAANAPKPSDNLHKGAQQSFLGAPEVYEHPPIQLLAEPKPASRNNTISKDALEQNARILEGVLEDFGVRGEILEVRPGPVVTLYELEPAPGIKSSRVIGLADDIARSMSAISARVAVIPGKNAIGIELPNQRRETVYFRELAGSVDFDKSKAKLAMALGKTINGESVIADLARMPHLLVAGTTGSGKSVSINTMILSLLYRLTPEECKMIMIDPKMLELSIYDGIPHLLTPVVTDPNKAVVALKWTVREMEDRYKKMSKVGVRNIDGFNARVRQAAKKGEVITRTVQTGFDRDTGEAIYEEEQLDLSPIPYIVVVVDEMADLMMVAGKDIEGAIQRLAQMARAAGIHLIMATQRPSVDVITGTIKANFPTRISFQVTSKIDSRTILGEMGAEQLLGMGDMLYMAGGGRIQRVHAPFITDEEVESIVNHLKAQGVPQYLDQVTEDTDEDEAGGSSGGGGGAESDEGASLYDKAVAIVLRDRKASTSYIQRRLSIGYNRAASLIERMENEGVISPANHAGKREILVPGEDEAI